MRALIRFWEITLRQKQWLIDAAPREMIRETIRCLKESERVSRLTKAEREAEAIRMAKEAR